jgi:hypothetical protein
MTDSLIPDLLRAVTTDIMLTMLLFTMSTPKYSKKSIYVIATVISTILNLGINVTFYLNRDYSAVVLADLL